MEHRWGKRVECRIPVLVEAALHGRIVAHATDVSLSGAFLRTRTAHRLRVSIVIEVDLGSAMPDQYRRITGYIVRKTAEGVGLEWIEFAPQAIRSLFEHSGRAIRNRKPECDAALTHHRE